MPRPTGKRGTFTFRVTSRLRERLEAAAQADERPVSEVIEAALEAHFASHDQRAMMREVATQVLNEREAQAAAESKKLHDATRVYLRKMASNWTAEEIAAFGPNRKVIGA